MALEIVNMTETTDFLKVAYDYGDELPLKRILLAAEAAGCKTVIKETAVHDEEYISEYDVFYKNVFDNKPPTEVMRLHLFKKKMDNFKNETLEKNKASYLGYCTLRPLKRRKISDAFISREIITGEESRFVYLICAMEKKMIINDVELSVSGFPYMQQDSRIAACAQIAIRLVSQYLSWKDGKSKSLTAPQITELVKEIPAPLAEPLRNIPTSGLHVNQMRAALAHLECDPIIYDYTFAQKEKLAVDRPEQIIYRYLESGLPVIVVINTSQGSRHALVVIGHTFNPDFWWPRGSSIYYNLPKSGERKKGSSIAYHCSTSWIQNFIVQDDNLGPYYFVDTRLFQTQVSGIAVPLPKNVYLTAELAEKQAWGTIYKESTGQMLTQALDDLRGSSRINAQWLKMFIDFRSTKELILRTYLRKSVDLKKDIAKFTRSTEIRRDMTEMDMPDYVWVVEISWPDIFCHMRKKCGEIIIDATAEADFITYDSVLAMHFPGIFYKRLVLEDDFYFKIIHENDQPSRHFYRKSIPIPLDLAPGVMA